MADLIIGFGTGRCGTNSLTTLLGRQGAYATHEIRLLPWETDIWELYGILARMIVFTSGEESKYPVKFYHLWQYIEKKQMPPAIEEEIRFLYDKTEGMVADVNFSWLNYIEDALMLFPDLRAVCLKRNREDTVKSWLLKDYDLWTIHGNDIPEGTRPLFPLFDLPLKEAVGAYWDEYYRRAGDLEKKYPDNVKIFYDFKPLNEEHCQRRLLDFIGIPREKQVIKLNIQLAKGKYA